MLVGLNSYLTYSLSMSGNMSILNRHKYLLHIWLFDPMVTPVHSQVPTWAGERQNRTMEQWKKAAWSGKSRARSGGWPNACECELFTRGRRQSDPIWRPVLCSGQCLTRTTYPNIVADHIGYTLS